jgi:hypothetical protein
MWIGLEGVDFENTCRADPGIGPLTAAILRVASSAFDFVSGSARFQMDYLVRKILIYVKVAARPLAASCHPVSPHDGLQSHEDTASDH